MEKMDKKDIGKPSSDIERDDEDEEYEDEEREDVDID
jgi:hypothetical protein